MITLAVWVIVNGQWRIQSNLLSLLPQTGQNQQFQAAENVLFSQTQNQVVILLSGEQAITAVHQLKKSINTIDDIRVIESQKPQLDEITSFYAPYRHNLLSENYQENLSSQEAISQLISSQLIQLSNPFVSETLAYDPRLNLADYLNQSFSQFGRFEYKQGVTSILSEGNRYYIVRLQLDVDGFSLKKGQVLARQLTNMFSRITTDNHVELSYSGIVFHTATASEQAEFEISVFGGFSLFAVILLVLFVFRSATPLLTAALVIAIASIYGFTAILLCFENIHLLTLVFAVTLIGIVIDYCFHGFIALGKGRINTIRIPLLLGFITTVLGYSALMFSPLELLTQVAVFMVFGLLGALVTVLMLFPHLTKLDQLTIAPYALKASNKIQYKLQQLVHFKMAIFVGLVLVVTSLLIVQPLAFNDDVRLLNSSPDNLLADEKTVGQVIGYQQSQRVIITAISIQSLLERQESVIQQLSNKQIDLTFKGIFDLLPSIKQQRLNYQQMKQADELGLFKQGLSITGLQDEITEFTPLTFAAISEHSALKMMVETYLTPYQNTLQAEDNLILEQRSLQRYALWLEINSKGLNQENRQWLAQQDKVKLFDKAADFSNVLAEYRQGILWLLMIAFIIVVLVIFLRYGLKTAIVGGGATGFSALGALVLSQWFSGNLNIFNLLGVLLILALAIDYVIFYIEQGVQSHTVLAITLSALSSAFVFGVLGMSVTPAVYSFGITVMFGIVLIFILAPLSNRAIAVTEPNGQQ